MSLPGGSVAPMLVTDPDALHLADPLAPVLPINAARAAANLTVTSHKEKLGVVLRSCEIRALVELCKFQQANLDNALVRVLGLDGKVVLEERRNDLVAGAELDLNLNNGIYLLELTSGTKRVTQRLVIQK